MLRRASVALASCKWQIFGQEPVVCHAIAKGVDPSHRWWALHNTTYAFLTAFMQAVPIANLSALTVTMLVSKVAAWS